LHEAEPLTRQQFSGLGSVEDQEEEASPAIGRVRRIGSVVMWVVIALAAAVSRFCTGEGAP